MRGYHAQNLDGVIDSYHYAPQARASVRKVLRKYSSVSPPYWQREFAVSWRDIDHDVEEA